VVCFIVEIFCWDVFGQELVVDWVDQGMVGGGLVGVWVGVGGWSVGVWGGKGGMGLMC